MVLFGGFQGGRSVGDVALTKIQGSAKESAAYPAGRPADRLRRPEPTPASAGTTPSAVCAPPPALRMQAMVGTGARIMIPAAIAAMLCAAAAPIRAELFDRGGGLIYDDVLDITWLQDADYAKTSGYDADGKMTWPEALAFVEGLVYEGYDDWRLPTLAPINGAFLQPNLTNNGSSDLGFAKTTTDFATDGGWRDADGNPVSEMGHMYYVNLGNRGLCLPKDDDPASCFTIQTGWGLNNVSFVDGESGLTVGIHNLQRKFYWTEQPFDAGIAWDFNFVHGHQIIDPVIRRLHVWPVRDGDSLPLR
jgi:hypothetical protein